MDSLAYIGRPPNYNPRIGQGLLDQYFHFSYLAAGYPHKILSRLLDQKYHGPQKADAALHVHAVTSNAKRSGLGTVLLLDTYLLFSFA